LRLYPSEALEISSISRLHTILSFIHHEVYIGAARRIRMQSFPVTSSPGNKAFVVCGIRINADDNLRPFRVAVTPRRVVLPYPARSSIDWIKMHAGLPCGKLRSIFHVLLDGAVAQFIEKIGFPIPLKSRWIYRVEHALQRRMGDWADKV